MFENLNKIIISFTEFGINNLLTIDNKSNTILFNDKYKTLNLNEFYKFLATFFRITREWENKSTHENFNSNFILNMHIFEKDKEYNLSINSIPNNFDSFLNLIDNK